MCMSLCSKRRAALSLRWIRFVACALCACLTASQSLDLFPQATHAVLGTVQKCTDYYGIVASSQPSVCCHASCGSEYCGTASCASGTGGSADCCVQEIESSGRVCGVDNMPAPCALQDIPCVTTNGFYASSGETQEPLPAEAEWECQELCLSEPDCMSWYWRNQNDEVSPRTCVLVRTGATTFFSADDVPSFNLTYESTTSSCQCRRCRDCRSVVKSHDYTVDVYGSWSYNGAERKQILADLGWMASPALDDIRVSFNSVSGTSFYGLGDSFITHEVVLEDGDLAIIEFEVCVSYRHPTCISQLFVDGRLLFNEEYAFRGTCSSMRFPVQDGTVLNVTESGTCATAIRRMVVQLAASSLIQVYGELEYLSALSSPMDSSVLGDLGWDVSSSVENVWHSSFIAHWTGPVFLGFAGNGNGASSIEREVSNVNSLVLNGARIELCNELGTFGTVQLHVDGRVLRETNVIGDCFTEVFNVENGTLISIIEVGDTAAGLVRFEIFAGDANNCQPGNCNGRGVCIDKVNGYECDCADGFIGDECEYSQGECPQGACFNGGDCIPHSNGWDCVCNRGFLGEKCEAVCFDSTHPDWIKDPQCCTTESPCGADEGVCSSDDECGDGLLCGMDNCVAVGIGPNWDFDDRCCYENACELKSPCANGGTCVPGTSSHTYVCVCENGWTGTNCHILATPAPTPVVTNAPSPQPTIIPTEVPTSMPTASPTSMPTPASTKSPTDIPTSEPTPFSTSMPTSVPTPNLTAIPTSRPTGPPSPDPVPGVTDSPSTIATDVPSPHPSSLPTGAPTFEPTSEAATACGRIYNGSLGVFSQPVETMESSSVDYDQCCLACSANASCQSISYLQGNASAAAECLLFSVELDEADLEAVAQDSAAGWVTAAVIQRPSTPAAGAGATSEESGVFDELLENKGIFFSMLVGVGAIALLYFGSQALERNTKRKLAKQWKIELDSMESDSLAAMISLQKKLQELPELTGSHGTIPMAGLTLIDFAVDCAFVVERFEVEGAGQGTNIPAIPWITLFFLVLPMCVNFSLVLMILRREFQSKQMRQWFFRNAFFGPLTILLSLGNPEALNMLVSRTFGSLTPGGRFNAPFTEKGIEKLHSVGLYANFLEDIPQLGLQVAVIILHGTSSWLTRVALITSALTLAFGLVRRIVFKVLYSEKRVDDAREEARTEIQLAAAAAASAAPASPLINPQLTEKYPQSVVPSVMANTRVGTEIKSNVDENSVLAVQSPGVQPEREQKNAANEEVALRVQSKEVEEVEPSAARSLDTVVASLSHRRVVEPESEVEICADEKSVEQKEQSIEDM